MNRTYTVFEDSPGRFWCVARRVIEAPGCADRRHWILVRCNAYGYLETGETEELPGLYQHLRTRMEVEKMVKSLRPYSYVERPL